MASLFWVGGTASYDGTTNHFATSTGGSATVAAVTSSDTVTFDSNSGTGTVTISANWSSGSVTMNQTGLTLTTDGTHTFTIAAASSLTLTNGTVNTNGSTCSWGSVAWGVGTKTLTLGASAITLSGTSGTVWGSSTSNTTFNSNTSGITVSGNGVTVSGNGLTFYDMTLSGTGSVTVSGANSFHNLTRTTTAGTSSGLIMSSGATVSNIFTVTGGNSATIAGRITVCPSLPTTQGTAATITVNGSVSLTNVDFNFITAAGSATRPWTGTSMGDGGGNSNITFDAPRTLYWVGTAGSWQTLNRWAASSGGTGDASLGGPRPQDDCKIDPSSGVAASGTFSTGLRSMGRNIDFTGMPNAATTTFSMGGFNPYITGSLTWAAGMTITNSAAASLGIVAETRSVTLTSNGVLMNTAFTIGLNVGATGGTFSLGDDLVISGTLSIGSGTFNTNNHNVTAAIFVSNNTQTRTLNFGTSTFTLSGTGVAFNCAGTTGLTFNGPNSTVLITDTSATGKTFEHRTGTIGTVTISGGGAATIAFGQGGTFTNLTLGANATYNFNTNATITNITNLTAAGTLGNTITIQSTAAGTPSTLKLSNTCVAAYCNFKDTGANAGASIYAADGTSTDNGNNHNVIFAQPKRLATAGVG